MINEKFANELQKKNPIEYSLGNYNVGRYAWILEQIELIKFFPAISKLRIWDYNGKR